MKNTIKFSNWLLKRTSNLSDVLIISFITFIFVVIFCLLSRKKRQLFLNRHKTNHNWNFNDLITKAHNCNVCEASIVLSSGLYCDTCQIYIDEKCLKKADKIFKCKILCRSKLTEPTSIWYHHWVKGNLPLNSICFKCSQVCGNMPGINDFKCVWCQRMIHEKCLNTMKIKNEAAEECDFGPFSNFILKPNFIFSDKDVNYKYNITDVKIDFKLADEMSNWTPLIVFANTKSGSSDADMIMKSFRGILNPLQIINMNIIDPRKIFDWMLKYSELVQFYVLVCGGDGSVGWLLQIVSKLKFKKEPAFAILPLGTGNDLSQCLGWGKGYTVDVEISDIINKIKLAENVHLDRFVLNNSVFSSIETFEFRWLVDINKNRKIRSLTKGTSRFMNNYLSIGCDALVTLNFHSNRETLPFSNRLLNKVAKLLINSEF